MKKIFVFAALLGATTAIAQPKVVEKAIIKMKTEVTFPENFTPPGGGDGGPGGGFSMPRDIETNTTVTYSPNFMKTESMSDFGHNTVIVDRANKKTTTLIEAMGRKTGFYSTDADAEAQRAKMDSMRNARRDSLAALGITFRDNKPELIYSDETKKISGYTCKKVTIKTTQQIGQVNESVVWYNPDFKVSSKSSTPNATAGGGFGGPGGGMAMMNGGVQGMNLIEGFPMEYEMTRGNGFKVHMTVLKIQLEPSIDDKEFEIPKGYDLKPQSAMENGGGFRMIFRNN
jgi:Domain of unknown function (DUF4412)